jgi:PAS domain S-box-containing protein
MTDRLRIVEEVARAAADDTQAHREAAVRFARLSESGIIGILVSDLSGHIIEANDTILGLVGYSRDEIMSGSVLWSMLTPPEWHTVDQLAIEQLTTSGIAGLREKEYIRKDGARIPVLIGSAMLDGEANQCISFVLDLTERKAAEAAMKQMREQRVVDVKAEQQRSRLAAIVDSSDDAIISKTLDGVITSWNQGAERMFGYTAAEIVGGSIALLMPPGHDDDELTIRAGVVRGEVNHVDRVQRRKDGTVVDVSATISPLRDAAGQVVGTSTVARDITDRRRAEQALTRAKDAAEASNRELEAFSYSVAHDLRAPLRGMNGFARILLDDYEDKLDAEGLDCLREILDNAVKMGALIDSLLALSRVTRNDWRPEPLDLSELFRAGVDQLAKSEPQRNVSVVVQPHLSAVVDVQLARALFDNLIGNAWKFTANVPAAVIEFGAVEQNGARVLFVKDNGAGFDMAHAGKLFAPFQRLHTVGEFPGTGIGLATVQRIVHRHGGRIWADAKVGGGAVIYFTLPSISREVA